MLARWEASDARFLRSADDSDPVRYVPRPPSPVRREPDAAVPARPRVRRAPRPARLRRVLVRRAPLLRLGDDRLARRCSWPPPGSAPSHISSAPASCRLPYHHPFNVAQRIVQLDHMTNGRAIFGSGPGALPVRRPHARHRPDGPARPPGRGARRSSSGCSAGEERFSYKGGLVRAERRPRSSSCRCRRTSRWRGVVDQAVGNDARRKVRHGRAVDRLRTRPRASRRCRPSGASPRRRPRTTARSSTGRTGGW